MSSGKGANWRFTLSGSVERSDDAMPSPLTDWACEQAHRLRLEQPSPQEWLITFPQAPAFIRDAFHADTIAQWSRLTGRWDWARGWSRSPLEEFIRSWGCQRPWVFSPVGERPDIDGVRQLIADAGLSMTE